MDLESASPQLALADGAYLLIRRLQGPLGQRAWLAVDQVSRELLLLEADPSSEEGEPVGRVLHIRIDAQESKGWDGLPVYQASIEPWDEEKDRAALQTARQELLRVASILRGSKEPAEDGAGDTGQRDALPARPASRKEQRLLERLQDSDPEERAHAAFRLGKEICLAGLGPLIASLEDSDPDVRRYAADALGKIGDRRAIEPLAGRLWDEDTWVAQWAASALHQLGEKPGDHGYHGTYSVIDNGGEERFYSA